MLIVIEGQDATGKDTQAALLKSYLEEQGRTVISYSESGTGSSEEKIAKIAELNYRSSLDFSPESHTLLYLINRLEQWRSLAAPTLARGDIVILSRNWFSTLIYEGYGAGVDKKLIVDLHRALLPESYFSPDKIVFFTLSDAERRRRLESQARGAELWKSKNSDFQHKLNRAYLSVAEEYHIPTLDASGSRTEVFTRLKKLFQI